MLTLDFKANRSIYLIVIVFIGGDVVKLIEDLLSDSAFKKGECWNVVRFKKEAKIVEQGEISRDLFLLRSGSVRVLGSVKVKNDRRIQPGVSDLEVGDIFGELSLFDHQPRSATIVCLEDTEVVVIDGDKLMCFLENNTDIGFKFMCEVMGLLVTRLRVSNEKVFSLFSWGLKAHKIDEHLS